MDLYKRRRGEWKAKAKGQDNSRPTGSDGDGAAERPKSKIDIARARFAQRAERARAVESRQKPPKPPKVVAAKS